MSMLFAKYAQKDKTQKKLDIIKITRITNIKNCFIFKIYVEGV